MYFFFFVRVIDILLFFLSIHVCHCNHQVCHRWRFLTNDVGLWKDKIATLGKPLFYFGSWPEGPIFGYHFPMFQSKKLYFITALHL